MALPIVLSYTFATATNPIPLSNLDNNFTTIVTTVNQLGNGSQAFSSITVSGDGNFTGTGQVKLPAGTTAERTGAALPGMLRYNTTDGQFEGYNGSTWSGFQVPTNSLGMHNRIINGAMEIDQRYGGAAVPNANNYTVDRWSSGRLGSGTYTVQQSTVAPSGFINSLLTTVTTSVTPSATDTYQAVQAVEGFNIADLAWGTSSAKTVTVSFWVRSSVTGLYAVSLFNGTRSYVATYTIVAANTWEYKTVTIPGDTSGVWATNNSAGVYVCFDLGSGSNFNASAANTWQSTGNLRRTSGCVSLISTNGATFYVTGVQLEVGSSATPFEWRPYGLELSLCQRYYSKTFNTETAPIQNSNNYNGVLSTLTSSSSFTGNAAINWRYPVQMRTTPTISLFTPGPDTTFIGCWTDSGVNYIAGTPTNTGSSSTFIYTSGGAATINSYCYIHASASAEL